MPEFAAGEIKVLAFDVFGTVVDWHGSISSEVAKLYPEVDAYDFASRWRAGYAPAMAQVMRGELGWTRIDELHRMILDKLLPDFGLANLDERQRQHLNRAWHRLDPWPDVIEGLQRLKTRYLICTLSNGNIGLLANMAKRTALPWDCILSAEVFRAYKPDPATYSGVARTFDLLPRQTMLVAAHHDDLAGARKAGMRTAYIERPLEFGAAHVKDVSAHAANDMHCRDFIDLADQLARASTTSGAA